MTAASHINSNEAFPRLAWIGISLFLLVFVFVEPLVAFGFLVFVGVVVIAMFHPDWILYPLILALPIQGIFVLTFGANIKISELLGCVLILAIAARYLVWDEHVVREKVITIPLACFLVVLLLSCLNTPRFRPEMALNQFMPPGVGRDSPDTRGYITALWGIYCALLLLAVPSAIRGAERIGRAIAMLVWSGALASAFGIFQYVYLLYFGQIYEFPGSTQHLNVVHSVAGGFPRSPASFIEPSVFAFFLIMILPVTLALAVGNYPRIVGRKTAFGIFVLDSIALLLSFAVSGYVMFLIVLLVFTYLATLRSTGGKLMRVARGAMAAVMIMLVILSLLQFAGVYPADVGEFVEQRLVGEADSAQVRFGLGQVALEMAHRHYLTGVGIGNYPFMAMNFPAAHDVNQVEFMVPTPSNLFLLFPAELGIPGFLVFLWLVARVYRFLARSLREMPVEMRLLHAGFSASLAGALLSFVFLDNLFVNYLWVILGVAVALSRTSFSSISTARPNNTRAENS